MPEWNFFAFDTVAVAHSILAPAQEAVRNHDLAAWQKVFDVLNGTHFLPHISRNGHCYVQPYTLVSGIVAPQFAISRDNIPDESDFGLRRTLQTFVEFMSPHSVQSRRWCWNRSETAEDYSYLRATMGSRRDTRQAERKLAAKPTAARITIVSASVTNRVSGSRGVTA
jgi:hypothetical protein